MHDLMSFKEAGLWASQHLGKNVTASNISYLVQYGRVPKQGKNGRVAVTKHDLKKYYDAHHESQSARWKKHSSDDLNWTLSFAEFTESETTKHVHRLHPYKGKFIPQLVEYFLDTHTDYFKKESFFRRGDIVLDPFCGSGTMLVQASELGLHAIGMDVSAFNAFISNVKIGAYDVTQVKKTAAQITYGLKQFQSKNNHGAFEKELSEALKKFNKAFFPSPAYKYAVRQNKIDEKTYGAQKADEFLRLYLGLAKKYDMQIHTCQAHANHKHDDKKHADQARSFSDKWFLPAVRDEIDFVFARIRKITDASAKKLLALALSRTLRSCRATTHADLGTLKTPMTTSYYCKKHGKICRPLFSILSWWERYAQDSITRVAQFDALRTDALQHCLVGDARTTHIIHAAKKTAAGLSALIAKNKINGIFSSPPYVGLIDYHEQHAYAYDLFGFERKDQAEIGALYNGQGIKARQSYVTGVSDALNNCKPHLKKNYDVFLVANDKYNLYPKIAELSAMKIVNKYKRPVLNRVEKDRGAYAEIIFHMKAL